MQNYIGKVICGFAVFFVLRKFWNASLDLKFWRGTRGIELAYRKKSLHLDSLRSFGHGVPFFSLLLKIFATLGITQVNLISALAYSKKSLHCNSLCLFGRSDRASLHLGCV